MEDLDFNPFFLALQKKFPKLYGQAQDACLMVLVPRASLLGNTTITQQMVEAHIYKPSSLFKDQYDSIGKPAHKIWVRDRIISTHEGFPIAMEAHVISEELFYNRQYQPFRVLCIDRVLTSPLSSDRAGLSKSESAP